MTVRGVCRVCGRPISLLRDGRIGVHGAKIKGQWPPERCAGWGQMPEESDLSASKARLAIETVELKQRNSDLFFMVVRLLTYVHNMQQDFPDLDWEDLPDRYPEIMWRYAV